MNTHARSPVRPGLVDLHTHVCPIGFPGGPSEGARAAWPCMCVRNATDATVLIGDKSFRELDDRSWSVARRREDMDRDGVAVQVLSPMPELLSYGLPLSDSIILSDHMNGTIADMVAQDSARFLGLGTVPLQNVGAAVAKLKTLRPRFGLDGIEIGSHIHGKNLGHPDLNPIWETAEALSLAVLVHPLHPLTLKLADVSPLFHPLVGFLGDGAIAGASLLMAGVLDRFPALRIGLVHGGGGLASVIPRLDQGFRTMPNFRETQRLLPSEAAKRLYFDSNVYDPGYLAYLINTVAADRMFVGTDYPYQIMQEDPAGYIAQADLIPAQRTSLEHGAAYRFLDI